MQILLCCSLTVLMLLLVVVVLVVLVLVLVLVVEVVVLVTCNVIRFDQHGASDYLVIHIVCVCMSVDRNSTSRYLILEQPQIRSDCTWFKQSVVTCKLISVISKDLAAFVLSFLIAYSTYHVSVFVRHN